MKINEFIKGKGINGYYVLDTTQDGLSKQIIHGEGDINYTRYCYNVHRYGKLREGSIFLYRQTKRSSKNRKFYFFGGGIIKEIISVDSKGNVQAMITDGFRLIQPIYEDDPKLDNITWTSKSKRLGEWSYFWNQYGMNEITEDEFLSIVGSVDIVEVVTEIGKKAIEEITEETLIIEKLIKKPEEFIGLYTNNGQKINSNTTKNTSIRTISGKKVDFDSLNKAKKTRGTLGEILIFNDEVARVASLNINKCVDHVAITKGDGLGYDILSYNDAGDEIYIEVKTTTTNKLDEFYLTPKELEVARDKQCHYKIYRVYNLNLLAGTYDVVTYDGSQIENMFKLNPVSYYAKIK